MSNPNHTLIPHPSEPWALAVRNRVDSASEDPLTTEEIMLVALQNELATLRTTREQDPGAAIEEAAKSCAGHDWIVIADHMRALVATVTNSQQKGGEERAALAAPQPATAKESTVRSDGIIHKLTHGEPEGWPVREFMEEALAREDAEEPCSHDEHDHGICIECGADITDRLIDAAEYRKDALEDR